MTITCCRSSYWLISAAALLLLSAAACRDKDPGFEVVTLEGKVESIEIKPDGTGKITVLYYSEKHKQDMVGSGLVTKNTEIMINGALAQLKDIREGEHVRGEVRIEKKNNQKRQTALKIYIDRAKPVGDTDG
ncbi:MAG: hypothetical protein JSU63_03205 [Phycisphaerales bacterium]|nr:MAG: hypothetical protein JSU63_03205 [Phycisphaerales bacterium]